MDKKSFIKLSEFKSVCRQRQYKPIYIQYNSIIYMDDWSVVFILVKKRAYVNIFHLRSTRREATIDLNILSNRLK